MKNVIGFLRCNKTGYAIRPHVSHLTSVVSGLFLSCQSGRRLRRVMMRRGGIRVYIMVIGGGKDAARWVEQIENQGEDYRCAVFSRAEEALLSLEWLPDGIILLPCEASKLLLSYLDAHPPVVSPYLWGADAPDGQPPLPDRLEGTLRWLRRGGVLPALAARRFSEARLLSEALLSAMGAPSLKAKRFLPEAIALCALQPSLQSDLQHGLYPRIAQATGSTPAAIERSLRLWIEATWSRGDLAAIERFFGSTVDPEKGKPTNREFLCGAASWVRRGLMRLQSTG